MPPALVKHYTNQTPFIEVPPAPLSIALHLEVPSILDINSPLQDTTQLWPQITRPAPLTYSVATKDVTPVKAVQPQPTPTIVATEKSPVTAPGETTQSLNTTRTQFYLSKDNRAKLSKALHGQEGCSLCSYKGS